MDGECSADGNDKTKLLVGKFDRKVPLPRLEINRWIILKWILKKEGVNMWTEIK
jgi:hypothetical protein